MLVFFQRFHRELNLLLVALFGLSCGHLASTIIGYNLRPQAIVSTPALPFKQTRSMVRQTDLNVILNGNIFAAELRGSVTTAPRPQPAPGKGRSEAKHRTDLILIGTLAAGRHSLAVVKSGTTLEMYRQGEQLPDGGRIETIDRKRVELRNTDQTLSVLELIDKQPATSRSQTTPETAEGIRAVDGSRWQIARSTAERAREDLAQQLRLAQMEPRIVNGRTNGFQVRMLNPRSILAKIGLRRADVVLNVNGMPLDSPEKGLQIMQQLREARRITVDIERDGQPLTFVYEIN